MLRWFLFAAFLANVILSGSCTETTCNCSPAQICGPDEYYDTCSNGGCHKGRTCEEMVTLEGARICVDPIKCKPGCVCKEELVRNSNGICIHKDKCPKTKKCPCNEIFKLCPKPCPPQLCSVDERVIRCAAPPKEGDPACKPGCECVDGFKRNDKGDCIPKDQCPRCKGQNEKYVTCPTNCPPNDSCDTYGKVYHCPAQIVNDTSHCKPACQCEKNFLRDKSGKCIPQKQCLNQTTTSTTTTQAPTPQNGTSDQGGAVQAPSQEVTSSQIDDAVQAISQGVNIFAFDFLKQVLKLLAGQNVIMSPFSCQIALAELALRAQGNTLTQLLAALNLTSTDQIRQGYSTFINSTNGGDGVTFNKAVNTYVNEEYRLNQSFINEIQDTLNGTVESINCNDPTGSADYINKRVASQTNNRIQDLISSDFITSLTRLILVNALYFQANWKVEFNINDTKPGDFYTSDNKTVQVSMMNIETKLGYTYSDALNAQIVQIPYVNSNFSFLVCLPADKNGLNDMLDKLNADTIKTAMSSLYTTKVKLSLPSMELNTNLNLVDILEALGVTDIFDSKSNLKGILVTDEDLVVSAAIQKAFVIVNEKGSEAAAATAIGVRAAAAISSPPKIPVVICDHPFLFFILANENPFFAGAFQTNQ